MQMKELIETTVWDSPVPNHTYYVCAERGKNIGKLMGYKPFDSDDIRWMKKPMKFDTRYRKFEEKTIDVEI